MKVRAVRVYDASRGGYRVLADRLWPRGVAKADARIDLWAKDAAPSDRLRRWFHADPDARFAEFKKRYRAELAASKALTPLRAALRGKGAITLVTAAKDPERSHIPVILAALKRTPR